MCGEEFISIFVLLKIFKDALTSEKYDKHGRFSGSSAKKKIIGEN